MAIAKIKEYMTYEIIHVSWLNEYWIVNKLFDALEHRTPKLSEAFSMAEAMDGMLQQFLALDTDGEIHDED